MTNMITTALETLTVLAIGGFGIAAYGAFAWHILQDFMHPSR